MSSYKNLKTQIRQLNEQLEEHKAINEDLWNQISTVKDNWQARYTELAQELFELKNMSWWDRLWDF